MSESQQKLQIELCWEAVVGRLGCGGIREPRRMVGSECG